MLKAWWMARGADRAGNVFIENGIWIAGSIRIKV
jgi:hypothetical protein